jgi:hypothetical protein
LVKKNLSVSLSCHKLGERRSTRAWALILAKGRESDGAGVLRIPDPAVLELKISWASGEQEKPDWNEKGPEGEAEELEGKEKLYW